jgi:CHAT domain-containing protein
MGRGDLAGAQRDLDRALAVFRVLQSLSGEFDSQVELARVQQRTGRETEALITITAALAMGDELGAQTINPEYRASVIQALRPAQELMVELLHSKYLRARAEKHAADAQRVAADALEFADGTRAQSFDRIQAQRYERTGNTELQRLLRERETLHRAIADRRFYLATTEERPAPADVRARVLREDIARLRIELGNKNTEISRALAGTAGNGVTPRGGVSFVLSRVRPNRAFVEYWLGATQAYAWVVRERQIHWVKLGNGPDIAQSARQLHEAMREFRSVPMGTREAAAARVYEAVITPLSEFLVGADALTIAADGPLHVVPFAALRPSQNDRYLVQRYVIAFVPAFRFVGPNLDSPIERQLDSKALLVADPIYQRDDPRLPGARQGLPADVSASRPRFRDATDLRLLTRLPATAREVAAIQGSLRDSQVVLLKGVRATRNALLSQDLSSYRYIHIATHGIIDTEIPRLSALILGAYDDQGPVVDQLVRVDDLLTATFNAELVTLSACNTSLGADFAGEGPVGLRYAVLARGAHSVVSSLWPVADVTTADLMTEMYGAMTNKGYRADMALAVAMRKLLEKRPTLDAALWAPYTAHLAEQLHREE